MLIAGGTLALGAGIVGVFIPVLPTTPFLLLAAACYLRSSRKLYTRLLGSRVMGAYVQDYFERKRMKRRAKAIIITLLWATIGLSAYLTGFNPVVGGIMLVVAAGVTIHIVLLRSGADKVARTGEESAGD